VMPTAWQHQQRLPWRSTHQDQKPLSTESSPQIADLAELYGSAWSAHRDTVVLCGCRQSGWRSIGAAPHSPEGVSGRIERWSCPSATGCCVAFWSWSCCAAGARSSTRSSCWCYGTRSPCYAGRCPGHGSGLPIRRYVELKRAEARPQPANWRNGDNHVSPCALTVGAGSGNVRETSGNRNYPGDRKQQSKDLHGYHDHARLPR
jgi:hypothetical protein